MEYLIFDDYDHEFNGCFYVKTAISGPGAPSNLDEVFKHGCDCKTGQCVFPKCSCVQSDNNYTKENGKRIIRRALLKAESSPVMECHAMCACNNALVDAVDIRQELLLCSDAVCINRWVQFGPITGLQVFPTEFKGLGLRTLHLINEGQFICEYAGEVISDEEAKRRLLLNSVCKKNNYVFMLKEHFGLVEKTSHNVDPAVFGNIGRYINHSCDPNSAIVPVRISGPVPILCVFAIKDIVKHEEITFDYSAGKTANEILQKQCLCGATMCRGFLPMT